MDDLSFGDISALGISWVVSVVPHSMHLRMRIMDLRLLSVSITLVSPPQAGHFMGSSYDGIGSSHIKFPEPQPYNGFQGLLVSVDVQ